MIDVLSLVARGEPLFSFDIDNLSDELQSKIAGARFLVVGGAGSIGQAVVREIFKRNPYKLDVVDLSENNLVELVRDLRSTIGYCKGDFQTFALDCASREFDVMVAARGPYDFVLNLSALKHVRSERDPYTLMRMVTVNVLNSRKLAMLSQSWSAKNYFCVSTDKATNPVNMMGASKRIMEFFLLRESMVQHLTMARFANVAFSDGSLLHGFRQRVAKGQPLSAPFDIRRYFLTPQESGELCLLSCLFGENRDIFFPRLNDETDLLAFSEIAVRYLGQLGFEPYICQSEIEARDCAQQLISSKRWPCYFFASDTVGEKPVEEFYALNEDINWCRFKNIGVIRNKPFFDEKRLVDFDCEISKLFERGVWTKEDLVRSFQNILPDFVHEETGRYLDQKM